MPRDVLKMSYFYSTKMLHLTLDTLNIHTIYFYEPSQLCNYTETDKTGIWPHPRIFTVRNTFTELPWWESPQSHILSRGQMTPVWVSVFLWDHCEITVRSLWDHCDDGALHDNLRHTKMYKNAVVEESTTISGHIIIFRRVHGWRLPTYLLSVPICLPMGYTQLLDTHPHTCEVLTICSCLTRALPGVLVWHITRPSWSHDLADPENTLPVTANKLSEIWSPANCTDLNYTTSPFGDIKPNETSPLLGSSVMYILPQDDPVTTHWKRTKRPRACEQDGGHKPPLMWQQSPQKLVWRIIH